jgi:surfeit locus 1 family protein
MGIARWSFRPSVGMTAVAALAIAATVSLGQWQQRRYEYKLSLAAALDSRSRQPAVLVPGDPVDPSSLQFRRVTARGEYVPSLGLLLDNKMFKGVAGYDVITPLKIGASGRHVLVNRGWVAAGARRDVLPAVPTPAGLQEVEGLALVPTRRFLELAPDVSSGPVRQNIAIDRLESELHVPLQPVVIQQTSESPDGLKREWERPDAGADRHFAYSMQWYSLAVLAGVLYVLLNFKRIPANPG